MESIESDDSSKPRVIAVAGGSCSGKTTLVQVVAEALGPDRCVVVAQDNYYRERGATPPEQINFDHPDAIDFQLFAAHLAELKAGQAVPMPSYDFHTHSRRPQTEKMQPRQVILVEGILVLTDAALRTHYDHSLFIECGPMARLQRRLARDVATRGRTPQSVRHQFANQVEPMHQAHVEPSKVYADRVFNQHQCSDEIEGRTDILLSLCRAMLAG